MYVHRRKRIVIFIVVGLFVIFSSIVFYTGINPSSDSSKSPAALAGTNRVSATPASTLSAQTIHQSETSSLSPTISGHLTPTLAQTGQTPLILPLLIVVELQPESPMPGGQFIWILNPSTAEINLGCWALHSTATDLTVIVEANLRVPAEAAAMLISQVPWLGVTDQIKLLDPSRHVIDQTPQLRDDAFDDQIWFRSSSGEWKFGRSQFSVSVVQGDLSTQTPAGC